jgi:RNA polymerase sigma factor (sigma-70 family)
MSTSGTSLGPARCLAALATARDPVAWAELLSDMGDSIRRCCARIVGPVLAEDAVQDTMLHLRDNAGRFIIPPGGDPDSAARAWILAVTANSALQMLRSERRLQHREHLVAAEAALHHDPDPAAGLVQEEQAAVVRRALANLPPAMRNAVALRHIEGLGSAEIAAVLSCPEGTAKALVHRGLERLRSRLEAQGVALGVAGLASVLASLPAAEGAGAAGQASGPGLLTSERRPSTEPMPTRPAHPDRLLRHAMALGLAAAVAFAWFWLHDFGGGSFTRNAPAPMQVRVSGNTPGITEADVRRYMEANGTSALFPANDAVTSSTSTSASTVLSSWGQADKQGRWIHYRVEQRDGGPWLEARHDDVLLWSGPVGSEAERALIPEDLILGESGMGFEFDVKHVRRPGENRLELRTGGNVEKPSSPQ